MSADETLDAMAAVHFQEWVQHMREIILTTTGDIPPDLARDISYDSLPESERKMRREVMRSVLTVAVTAIDDEVLVDAMDADEIAMHEAADLSQRLDYWLNN